MIKFIKSNLREIVKIAICAFALISLIIFLIMAGIQSISILNNSTIDASSSLSDCKTFRVKKLYFNIFQRKYYIYDEDNACIGCVKGEIFPVLGEVFSLSTGDGNNIFEKEEILHLNRQAQFYDKDGAATGRYESKLLTLLDKNVYTAKSGEEYQVNQKIGLHNTYKVYDSDGNTVATIRRKFWIDDYTVTIESSSDISNEELTLITCINDAVNSSKSNSSNHNKD